MPNPIAKHRSTAFHHQNGRCFYCATPMWLSKPDEFAAKNGLSKRAVRRYQCTAEHLVARQDGGANCKSNIVAACRFCNHTRHCIATPPEPDDYRQHVEGRMKAGRWHPLEIRPTISAPT